MATTFLSRSFRRTRERAAGLLFSLGIDDSANELATGQSLTLTRATGRTVFDSTGRVATLAHSQMPWSAAYNAAAGIWEPVLDVGNSCVNKCLRSENFGTLWTAIGTPTRVAAAASIGDVALDLIGDDAAGTLEGYSQTIGFAGNGVKALSLFVKQDTSTSSVIRLRDTTASANRALGTLTWSGGVPSVAMSPGAHYATEACANGGYRLLIQSASVTAANTNVLEIYPATTSALAVANTGRLYVGGVQAEDAPWCRAYVRSDGSSGTANQDQPMSTVDWPAQDFTLYARVQRPAWAALSGTLDQAFIVNVGTGLAAGFNVQYSASTRTVSAQLIDDAGTGVSASGSIPGTDFYDFAAKFVNVRSAGQVYIDTGSGYGAASPATGPSVGNWSASVMRIGHFNAVTYAMDAGIRKLVLAAGARTLAELRGLNA